MKKDIHPQLNDVKVHLVDGTVINMKSTMKKEELKLDIDPTSHPAWTGKRSLNDKAGGRADKFKKKFGNFSI